MQRLIARHGAMPVVLGLIAALLKPQPRRKRAIPVDALGPHLRRDIGLPPLHRKTRHWDHF